MFRLSIVTPERVVYDAEVKSLSAPGTDGYLGVLSQHAPLITALKPGKLEYRDADDKLHILAVTRGFLEVSGNVATILADAVESADQIDIDRARSAYRREKSRLVSAGGGETDLDLPSVREALERAANRIKVYEDTHH
ncbi:MAG: ATP synthase F1 subunit epsilon [candidate division Zixibacteria bacterium]|nr:ATP synthase F1 subunit epsilon [candidate division Zixibacteria bacterium]